MRLKPQARTCTGRFEPVGGQLDAKPAKSINSKYHWISIQLSCEIARLGKLTFSRWSSKIVSIILRKHIAMTEIRRIAIFVDEPDPGLFFCVLIENGKDAEIWTGLAAAEKPKTTWRAAFDAGSVALLAKVADQAAGPLTN